MTTQQATHDIAERLNVQRFLLYKSNIWSSPCYFLKPTPQYSPPDLYYTLPVKEQVSQRKR
jgi:hypothetical protein